MTFHQDKREPTTFLPMAEASPKIVTSSCPAKHSKLPLIDENDPDWIAFMRNRKTEEDPDFNRSIGLREIKDTSPDRLHTRKSTKSLLGRIGRRESDVWLQSFPSCGKRHLGLESLSRDRNWDHQEIWNAIHYMFIQRSHLRIWDTSYTTCSKMHLPRTSQFRWIPRRTR